MADETKINSVSVLEFGDEQYHIDPYYLGGHEAGDYVLKDYLDTFMVSALEYCGDLDPKGENIAFPAKSETGNVYIVISDGQVDGNIVAPGDTLICKGNDEWTIVQGNFDLNALDELYAAIGHAHNITDNGHAHGVTPTKENIVHNITKSDVSASGSYTPEGTISEEKITPAGTIVVSGHEAGHTVTEPNAGKHAHIINYDFTHTPAGSVTVTGHGSHSVNQTPAGGHTHTATPKLSTTAAGNITISEDASGDATFKPAGTISMDEGHTHSAKVTATPVTPAGSISNDGKHTHDWSGSIDVDTQIVDPKHAHAVVLDTAPAVTAVNANDVEAWYFASGEHYDSETKTLKFAKISASKITSTPTADFVTDVTVSNAETNITAASTGSVTGTVVDGGQHSHNFTGTKFTPEVSVEIGKAGDHRHSFTGKGVALKASFTGTQAVVDGTIEISTVEDHDHDVTVTGGALDATFSGTQAPISGQLTSEEAGEHKHGTTVAGSGLTATFTGTEFAHRHTFTGTDATIEVTGDADIEIDDHTEAITAVVVNNAKTGITVNPNA